MTDLQLISFHEDTIETFEKDGNYYVVMKTLCEALQLNWATQYRKISNTDLFSSTVVIMTMVAQDGKARELVALPIDMISAWLFSINPKKVSEELAPKLIKYQVECAKVLNDYWRGATPKLPSNYEEALEHLLEKTKEARMLSETLQHQAKVLEEQKPKVSYHDIVLACPDLLTITKIAQDYGMTAQKLNKLLCDEGVQYKDKSGMWCVKVKYLTNNYAQTFTYIYQDKEGRDHAKLHLKWTQKGRLFIYETLKAKGILPIVEQEG